MSKESKKIGDVVKVGTNLMELIEFIIEKEDNFGNKKVCHYGINVFKVREVIKTPSIVPLPSQVPYIEGIFNLRNENIPLLNLVERVGGKPKNYEENEIIVAEFNNIFIGFLVHKVLKIHRISWDKIIPAPKMSGGPESEVIIGIVHLDTKDSLVILDFEKIVSYINPLAEKAVEDFLVSDNSVSVHKNKTVLMVDDSKLIRTQMDKFLRKLGFTVILAENGLEALNKIHKLKEEADAEKVDITEKITFVITDIEMPQMDGYTLTSEIKKDPQLSVLPVVMHTSLSGDNVKLRGKEVGADEYITKFSAEHINATVNKIMSKYLS